MRAIQMSRIVGSEWLPEKSTCRPFQPDRLYTLNFSNDVFSVIENNNKKKILSRKHTIQVWKYCPPYLRLGPLGQY